MCIAICAPLKCSRLVASMFFPFFTLGFMCRVPSLLTPNETGTGCLMQTSKSHHCTRRLHTNAQGEGGSLHDAKLHFLIAVEIWVGPWDV